MTRRREISLVGITTLLGAALRLYQIGAQSLWLDELFSVAVARGDWAQVVARTAQGDTNPPLFNLLLHVALQFGSDEMAARAVSCLFSIATIPLFYALARQLFQVRVAALATLVLAINPFHVYFAQEARMYAQLAFFSMAGMFFFLRAWHAGGFWDWAFFALAMALAFYTHSLAFLNLLALDVWVLTQRGAWQSHWRGLLSAHAVIAIAFAPWFVVLLQQLARVQAGFWAASPTGLNLAATPYLFLFSNVLPTFFVPIALFAGLALCVFALVAAVRAIASRDADAPALLFALAVFGIPLLALFGLSLIRPIYLERTLLPASFGLYLLLAWTVVRARPRALNVALGALVMIGMIIALPEFYFNPDVQKPQLREATRALSAQFRPGDVIAHTSDLSALAFMYYNPALPSHFLAGDPDYAAETTRGRSGLVAGLAPEDIDSIVAGRTRVWLVVALDHNVDYQKARVREFDQRFYDRKEFEIGNIDLLSYDLAGGSGVR